MRSASLALVLVMASIGHALPALAAEPSPGPGVGAATVSLLIYSGRPAPAWPIDPEQLERLEEIVAALQLVEGEVPLGGLGYHGFGVEGPSGRWMAYQGTVQTPDLAPGTFLYDPRQEVERFLLETGQVYLSEVETATAAEALGLAPGPEATSSPVSGASPSA